MHMYIYIHMYICIYIYIYTCMYMCKYLAFACGQTKSVETYAPRHGIYTHTYIPPLGHGRQAMPLCEPSMDWSNLGWDPHQRSIRGSM